MLDRSDYRSLEERLAEWRTEILTRMDREDELSALPTFARVNLARDRGTGARVDSYLGTANPPGPDDAYPEVLDAATGRIAQGALPFAVEDPQHPVLVELRRRFPLHEVAGDGPDLDRAVRLRDWIKSLFPHRIPFRMPEWNALLVLDRGSRGVEYFICVHYSVSLVQCALAVGIQARVVNLHRGISDSYRIGDEAKVDPPVDEHVVAEVWSSELGRWMMMDTDFDCHYERDGVPLSAWDIHRAFVEGELDAITCRRGPHSASFNAYGEGLPDDDAFFARELPSYYAHISLLMRNDFLSDPDGPVPMAHPLDEHTAPILWHRGSDNRLQPHLMGPVVVAQTWTDRTPVLTDGNRRTGWASADTPDEHVAEVGLDGQHQIGQVVLHWPEYRLRYQTSAAYRLECQDAEGRWTTLAKVSELAEAPYTVHDVEPTRAVAVRVVQEPGGGAEDFPNRLWLNQIELYAPAQE